VYGYQESILVGYMAKLQYVLSDQIF
jgi:hypothetical protein